MDAPFKWFSAKEDEPHVTAYRSRQDLDWEQRAKINPLFAIMSEDVFRESGAIPTPAELGRFYSKGKMIWNRYFGTEWITLTEERKATDLKVLEFGCGMGRVLSAPAENGVAVCGVDISPTQVELAQKFFPGQNAEFRVLRDNCIPWESETFDYVYTFAVLQHIKQTSILRNAIQEMCRVLKKDGMLKIQIPTIQRNQFSPGERKYIWSISFEESSLVFYWMKRIPFLPMLRLVAHTNLAGAAFYFELPRTLKILQSAGIQITKVEFHTGLKSFVIIAGKKTLSS